MDDSDAVLLADSSGCRVHEAFQASKSPEWRSSGPLELDEWGESVACAARLVASSTAPMGVMIGPQGIIYANQIAERLLVETLGAVNGRSVLDILPDDASYNPAGVKKLLAGGAFSLREQAIRLTTNGIARTHWFNLDFTPVKDQRGVVQAVLVAACDLSAYVRRTQELSDSERKLHLALGRSGVVGLRMFDVKTNSSLVDSSFARIHGLKVDACGGEVDEDSFLETIHPEDRGRVESSIAEAIKAATHYRCRYRIIDGGQVRWVVGSGVPSRDEAGDVAQVLNVVVEVTEQMQNASALAESRFHFQTLTEALPQIVWSCDAEGRHDYFSGRWSEFTGIQPEDITEDTWKFLVYPEHQQMVASAWQQALRTGEAYDIDYRFRHHSGEYRWLRVMALPLRDDCGRMTRWFGTSTDIHEAYLMAEERDRFARELERIATEDQLTGVLTRRAFVDKASAMLADDVCTRRPSSLLMLDIDHFKSINDNYGHPVGDRVLAATAGRIKAAVREQDFVGRLGGEEFAVFLPRCSRRQALLIAERIRHSVEENPVSIDGGRNIVATVSLGATSVVGGLTTLDRLLSIADQALYKAKFSGRNQVSFARGSA